MKRIIALALLACIFVSTGFAGSFGDYRLVVEDQQVRLFVKMKVNEETTFIRWKVVNNTDQGCTVKVVDKSFSIESGGTNPGHDVTSHVGPNKSYVFSDDVVRGEVNNAGAQLVVVWD